MANIGKFNQRIAFYTYSSTQNSMGEVVRSFTLYKSRWAEVVMTNGNETSESDQKVSIQSAIFKVRKQGLTINPTSRILWRGKYYNILSIVDSGQILNEILEIVGEVKDNE